MNETHETPEPLSAVLAEFRAFALRAAEEDKMISPENVLLLADKVEAAAERERETADLRAIHRCHDCERENAAPGNAAAMREALERIADMAPALGGFEEPVDGDSSAIYQCARCDGKKFLGKEIPAWWGAKWRQDLSNAIETASAALAAPPRNCDRFEDGPDALFAYKDTLRDGEEVRVPWLLDWLFDPAEGGGAKCIDGLRGHPDCRGCDEHCLDVRKRNCFYWNPDIGKCALDGKPSCRIACDNFRVSKEEKPAPAEGGAE